MITVTYIYHFIYIIFISYSITFYMSLNKTPNSNLNSLPKDNLLDWSKLKAFADDEIYVTEKLKSGLGQDRKHCGKRRKCWLPAFSLFPALFSEDYFLL